MKKDLKKQKDAGITLIALVITIIVLLILAGISIAMLTAENGVISKAQEASTKVKATDEEEKERLTYLEALSNVNGTIYQGVKIPAGFIVSKKEGENTLDDGLVIIDSLGNEYVWIEVPNNLKGPTKFGPTYPNGTTNKDYEVIEDKLYKYIDYFYAGDDYWTDSNGIKFEDGGNIDDNAVFGLTYEEYISLKHSMLTSIFDNQGFWIGRYEAGMIGINGRANENEPIDELIPLSKPDLIPITYVTCAQAQKLANKVYSGEYHSNLLFGIQWNLAIKYIEEKTVAKADVSQKTKVRNTIKNEITSNSTNWGNYSNSSFIINKGRYKVFKQWESFSSWVPYETEDGINVGVGHKKLPAEMGNGILLTTGGIGISKINLYDIAGNVCEYTFENDGSGRIFARGGMFVIPGNMINSSAKMGTSNTTSSLYYGFRVAIY